MALGSQMINLVGLEGINELQQSAALFTPIAPLPSSFFLMVLCLVILLFIVSIITMNAGTAGFKKLGEIKRRELVAELNGMGEGVIAKAVEGSIGCLLENGVLHLQYPQPSRHSGHAKILRDLVLRPILERAARQIDVEILIF
jgi:hypothetical protein